MAKIWKYSMKRAGRAATMMAALAACVAGMTGCHSIFDESDCESSYTLVKLTYDHNMKFADAFGQEVDKVTLMAFDAESGTLAKRIEVKRSEMTQDHEVVLDMEPGRYDLLVWGGEYDSHFDIASGRAGEGKAEDFHCYLKRSEALEVTEDLPGLYHGMATVDLPYASSKKPHRETVNLKKNTNEIRIVLQHLSGEPLIADDYEMTITDGNGWLNHDNSLRDNTELTYRPWYTHSGSVDINSNPNDAPGSSRSEAEALTGRASLGATLAEFTTSRLLMENNPTLTVRHSGTKKVIFSIPVNDYALLVKGYNNKAMSDQEYLDRQDEYNMTFFLDERGKWLSSVIIINNWRIVRHDQTLE